MEITFEPSAYQVPFAKVGLERLYWLVRGHRQVQKKTTRATYHRGLGSVCPDNAAARSSVEQRWTRT